MSYFSFCFPASQTHEDPRMWVLNYIANCYSLKRPQLYHKVVRLFPLVQLCGFFICLKKCLFGINMVITLGVYVEEVNQAAVKSYHPVLSNIVRGRNKNTRKLFIGHKPSGFINHFILLFVQVYRVSPEFTARSKASVLYFWLFEWRN